MKEKTIGQKWKRYTEFQIEDMRQGNVAFDGTPDDMAVMVYGFLNWLAHGEPAFEEPEEFTVDRASQRDPRFDDAVALLKERKGKTMTKAWLKLRLLISYARASALIDQLEEAGIIGPKEAGKPRKVL